MISVPTNCRYVVRNTERFKEITKMQESPSELFVGVDDNLPDDVFRVNLKMGNGIVREDTWSKHVLTLLYADNILGQAEIQNT